MNDKTPDFCDSPSAVAYVRLSREDLNAPGSLEEKFANRSAICEKIAREARVDLDPRHIYCERASGTKLSARPIAQAILSYAATGNLAVLVTPYQDRLLRGDKVDEQSIEDALCAGNVTLLSADGVMRFDKNYDTTSGLLFSIKSAVARHFVADLIRKRKESDAIKLANNIRTRGFAPYGYRYLRPTYDATGRQLTPQAHEIEPAEYEIVCEIFARALNESTNAICRDLNDRAVPSPGGGKRWYRSRVRDILRNPWYAGHLAQRDRIDRAGRRIHLATDEYILSEREGDWTHPINLAEWYEIQAYLDDRKSKTAPRTGLLTGILYCPMGRRMCAKSQSMYGCYCKYHGEPHPGTLPGRMRLDQWIQSVVTVVVCAIPETVLQMPAKPIANRRDLSQRMEVVRANAERLKGELTLLIRQSATLGLRFAAGDYDAAIAQVTVERDEAAKELAALQTLLRAPDMAKVRSLLLEVRPHLQTGQFWDTATPEVQRAVVHAVIERIDLEPVPDGRTNYRDARLTLFDLGQPSDIQLPPFQRVRRFVYGNGNVRLSDR